MKRVTTIVFIFAFVLSGLQANEIRDRFAQFAQNAHLYSRLNPQEKVYLHFDNTGYFEGETIWFKAYIVTAKNHQPTDLSRILYVELLAPDGKIVDERKLKIENGQCHGEFALSQQIRPGYYEVRAYTRYMLNFGDETVFSRVFPILTSYDLEAINREEKDEVGDQDVNSPFLDKMRKEVRPPKKEQLVLSFYPEGGHLVQGLPTQIAFKATDEQGRSVAMKGALFNPRKEAVDSIETQHQGMGVFEFTHYEAGYYVEVLQGKKKYRFDLPPALPKGYGMTLQRQNEQEQVVTLERTAGLPAETLGLAVTCRGSVVYFETFDSGTFPFYLNLEDKDFPEGVNRLTLFDAKGEILADRLFFIKREPASTLTVTTDKESYLPFEKIKMTLDLSLPQTPEGAYEDASAQVPFRGFRGGGLSLSIRDGSHEPAYSHDDIRTNLLLSSDLQGYIEKPAYYFEKQDEERTRALDLLMLVQGWRRYSWHDAIANTKHDRKHYIEKEILIKGQILSDKEGLPLEGIEVNIQMVGADSLLQKGRYITGATGDFIFQVSEFDGRKDLLLITDSIVFTVADSAVVRSTVPIQTKITLDRQIAPVARTYPFSEIEEVSLFKPAFYEPDSAKFSSFDVQHLSGVTVKRKKFRRPIMYNVDKEVTYYRDLGMEMPYWSGHTYLLHRNKRYAQGNKNDLSMPYKGTQGIVGCFLAQGIWIDEQKKTETEKMSEDQSFTFRKIEEIEQIEIIFEGSRIRYWKEQWPHKFKKNYIVRLVTPFEKKIEFFKGTRYTHLQGFSITEASFQQPDYDHTPPLSGDIDYRRTLYWNPNVQLDELIEFYNNSDCKVFIVSAQGVTKDGGLIKHLIRKEVNDGPLKTSID